MGFFSTIFLFVWDLFKTWLGIMFSAPLKNLEMLWIIIPIWVNWFFAEFFQEKKGTSLGNAISNGGVLLWVGIDWIRYLFRLLAAGTIKLGALTVLKFVLALTVFGIGMFIVVEGVKTKKFVHFVGRVRETTYLLVMISPIVYGVMIFSWKVFIAMVVFAPLFYYVIELLCRITPTPKTYKEELPEKELKLPEEKPVQPQQPVMPKQPYKPSYPYYGFPKTPYSPYPGKEKPKI